MITCNLNKPESTFDTIRKAYKELQPTDAALIATALVEAGRFADAVYDEKSYAWSPDQHDAMTRAIAREVIQVNEAIEEPKKKVKVVEEESVTLSVLLKPSQAAGELFLADRDDLKTLLGDILEEGVEYLYASTDLGWQWTLERVNWATLSEGEMKRHIKFRADFVEPHIGVELGPGGKRKKK